MKRHLLITIVDGFHYRYLVQGGILDLLAEASDKVIVCGTEPVLQALERRGDRRLVLAPLPQRKVGRGIAVHQFLRSCGNLQLSETLNIKAEQQREQTPWRYRVRRWLGKASVQFGIDAARWLEHVWHDPTVLRLMQAHGVTRVVLSTPGQKLEDLPFLEAARRLGISTVSPVYSWDNLTAKGPFVLAPDRLVVWNEVMRDEACRFHDYAPEAVAIGGVPVFDPYLAIRAETNDSARRVFLSSLGLDPHKRLVTLTTIPRVYFGSSHRLLAQMIKGWMTSGALGQISLLIRPHPLDDTDYRDLEGADVVVDDYGSRPDPDPRRWHPADDNAVHLGRTMAFSDVVINIASTITVDAACFDTPIVNVAFDLKPRGDEYVGSVARYYRYTHYRQVVETRAATLVQHPSELLPVLADYLNDRSKSREGRTRLVRTQVGQLDGAARKRTANALLGSWATR